ncbi:MAG: methylated-DNA--[protein]-cysteine S-methyltransferase [Defluviitaleaceae bacterium]|nr:methylated-DNA--[protein]-cysteine S-methyltransferase [Defluviitaleaceae bacterium]
MHTYESPVGPLRLTAKDGFITGLYFNADDEKGAVREAAPSDAAVLKQCVHELGEYFAGRLRAFTVPIKPEGTPFRMKVWEALLTIPYGETISYKKLAERINHPSAIRAVGGANHHNPISIIIPCHRVIGASGKLVGYGGGLDVKERLLQHERK